MEKFKKLFTLDNSSFLTLSLLCFLIPIFFIPFDFVSFQFSKTLLISLGIVLAFIFFVFLILKSGTLYYPHHPIFYAAIALPVVYLVSSLVAETKMMSLFGHGFEANTFTSIFFMMILFFLGSMVFSSTKRLTFAYAAFFLAAAVLVLFHVLRIFFGADFLSFGIFSTVISNTIGKWNEVAIFFGISALLSLITLELIRLRPAFSYALYALLVLSLAVVGFANFAPLWYVIGFFALLLFVYTISSQGSQTTMTLVGSGNEGATMKSRGRKISIKSLVVIIIALAFVTPIGKDLSTKIASRFNVNNSDVRPSFAVTMDIAKASLKSNPIVGSGPNTFSKEWQLHKPDVNLTNFWSTDFSSGYGFIPTAVLETGILGLLAWIVFIVLFLYAGFKSIVARSDDRLAHYFAVASFFIALYLWVMNIIYVPSSAIIALTFFWSGLSIAAMIGLGALEVRSIPFIRLPKTSFVFVMAFVFALIIIAGFGYFSVERALSAFYFQKGNIVLSNEGNLNKAEEYFLKAINFTPNDIYYRNLADLKIARLNNIIASVGNQPTVADATRNEFQNILADAIEFSRKAELRDSANFENWASVARVYQTITPIGIAGAYDTARASYEEALKLSPKNPALYLELGRLEAANNDLKKAREYTDKALELKFNYPDAIFFLSQIDVSEGNLAGAISAIEKAVAVSPSDPNAYFRLGLLKYEAKDFIGAVSAFERSVSLVPVYANAKYFLGLSYSKIGKNNEAIAVFEELLKDNPGNNEVESILNNFKSEKDPFDADDSENLDKREKLPIIEKDN